MVSHYLIENTKKDTNIISNNIEGETDIDYSLDFEADLNNEGNLYYDDIINNQTKIKETILNLKVESGDNLYTILKKTGFTSTEIYYISEEINKNNKEYLNMKPNNVIKIKKINDENVSIDLYKNSVDFLRIVKDIEDDNKFLIYEDSEYTENHQSVVHGIITNSLSYDGSKAGLTVKQINQLANIFAWDIDFTRDLRKGNKFSLIFEEIKLGEKTIGTGNILAVYFETARGNNYAISYEDNGDMKYYDLNGNSLEKAFLKAPVEFERITSKFTTKRFHPILKINRPHRGVDYGGRLNTPIMSVGDGIIKTKGRQNAYGNMIVIDHGNGYETLYAHLNRFNNKFKTGSKVKQGDIIGYMGKTGLATGVHLHYEMRLHNDYKDPLTIKLPDGLPVKNLENFNVRKNELLEKIKAVE